MTDKTAIPTGGFLVLGSTGYLGHWITRELDCTGTPWTGTCQSEKKIRTDFPAGFMRWDFRNASALTRLLEKTEPKVVLNAISHPPAMSDGEMRNFYVESTTTLLNTIREVNRNCRVVLVGSAAEYGNAPERGKSKESDLLNPLTAYGRVKAEQSRIAARYAETGLNVVTGRIFNMIGPGQSARFVAGSLFKRLHDGERPLRVQACNFIRDWIDVRDAARALVILGDAPVSKAVVNICSGHESTVEDLARKIVHLCSGTLESLTALMGPDVLWRSIGDNSLMKHLKWRPAWTLKQSLYEQWLATGSFCQGKRLRQ